jgi:hypothetical protein
LVLLVEPEDTRPGDGVQDWPREGQDWSSDI